MLEFSATREEETGTLLMRLVRTDGHAACCQAILNSTPRAHSTHTHAGPVTEAKGDEPIRVGYLADFSDEKTVHLLLGILLHHDRYLAFSN